MKQALSINEKIDIRYQSIFTKVKKKFFVYKGITNLGSWIDR
jgi:hypothetical protein